MNQILSFKNPFCLVKDWLCKVHTIMYFNLYILWPNHVDSTPGNWHFDSERYLSSYSGSWDYSEVNATGIIKMH